MKTAAKISQEINLYNRFQDKTNEVIIEHINYLLKLYEAAKEREKINKIR